MLYSGVNQFPVVSSIIMFSSQIADMVAVALIMNATLVIPQLDRRSFWKDTRYWSVFEHSFVGVIVVLLNCVF